MLAVLLITFDHRSAGFHRFRDQIAVVVTPVQYVVSAPIRLAHWLGSGVTAQKQLLKENDRLRANNLLLQAKLHSLLSLKNENLQLRELLQSSSQIAAKRVIIAQILAVNLEAALSQLVIDRGKNAHVYVGQPVLDAYGVMGQVIDVGPLTSKVLLVTDQRSAVPVQDVRNGIRAIAVGVGESDALALINVPDTTQIQVGDLFLTSGMGTRYPVGYPVGVVANIAKIPGRRFATITLVPSAHVDQTQQVLLAWPTRKSLFKAVHQQLKLPVPTLQQ